MCEWTLEYPINEYTINLYNIEIYNKIFTDHNIYEGIRNAILYHCFNNYKLEYNMEFVEYLINYLNSDSVTIFNGILQKYVDFIKKDIFFLEYSKNFSRNNINILDHTVNYIVDGLMKNKNINIDHIVVPSSYRLSDPVTNISFLKNKHILWVDKNYYYIRDSPEIVISNMYPGNKNKYSDVYDNFNVNDLKMSPINNPEIIGLGFTTHDALVKKLRLSINDDIYNYDYDYDYFNYRYCFSNKQSLMDLTAMPGKNHPLIKINNLYYEKPSEAFGRTTARKTSRKKNRRAHN
jgi:hypothetical protein